MFLSKLLWIIFMFSLTLFICNIAFQGLTKLKQTRVKRLVLSQLVEDSNIMNKEHLEAFDSSIILYDIKDDVVENERYIIEKNKRLPLFKSKPISKIGSPSFKTILDKTETNNGTLEILGQKYVAVTNHARDKLALVLY